MRRTWVMPVLLAAALPLGAQPAEGPAPGNTALEQLQAATKPRLRPTGTLVPLSTWVPELPFGVRMELARHWGFALQFGRLRPELVAQLDDPGSVVSKVCAQAKADPKRYPLHVIVAPAFSLRGYVDDLPPQTWCRDAEGNLIDETRTWSPEAPDEAFARIARFEVDMLEGVKARAPIAIVTNGGEYALSTIGHCLKAWEQDPRVVRAKGERDWYDYISERKAHQELIISERLREELPDRQLYIYYYTDGCPHRDRYATWWEWAWDYKHMRPVSDIPNSSLYYGHYNTGWGGQYDMLTQALNSVAQQIAAGDPLSYNWTNAGWPHEGGWTEEPISDPEHYLGYLKCYYTAGMIGGVAGYFEYDDAANWIWQLMILSRAHALFSHLEGFLRNGDLLPGPERHRWSQDLPAYEFPTGDDGARVLARKHRQRDEWLLTAWAGTGEDREVTVTVPELGEVRLLARACGSVYRAIVRGGRPVARLVDEDGMEPTASLQG